MIKINGLYCILRIIKVHPNIHPFKNRDRDLRLKTRTTREKLISNKEKIGICVTRIETKEV